MDNRLFEALRRRAQFELIPDHVCDHAKSSMLGGGGIASALRVLQPHFDIRGVALPTLDELHAELDSK